MVAENIPTPRQRSTWCECAYCQ